MLLLAAPCTCRNRPAQYFSFQCFSRRQLWRKLHLLRKWLRWSNCTLWFLFWGIRRTLLVSPCYWSWVWDKRLNWPKFLFTKHSLTLSLNAQNLGETGRWMLPSSFWIFSFQLFHENLMTLSKCLWQALWPLRLIVFEKFQPYCLFTL